LTSRRKGRNGFCISDYRMMIYGNLSVGWCFFLKNFWLTLCGWSISARNGTIALFLGIWSSPPYLASDVKFNIVRAPIEAQDGHNGYLDGDSNRNQSRDFFISMVNKYKNKPNVIFKIYKEPISESLCWIDDWCHSMYSETPFYCQHVDIASQDPITSFNNVAYSLHFYDTSW
jgi:hypothetical protein